MTTASPHGLARGDAILSVEDSSVSLGFGNPAVPGQLNLAVVTATAGNRGQASAMATLTNVQLASAGRVVVAELNGGGGLATNSSTATLTLIRSHVTSPQLDVATKVGASAGTATGRLEVNDSLVDIAGPVNFGSGATASFVLGGTTRSIGTSGAGHYGAIDAQSATLAGLLEVTLAPTFAPAAGDVFDLIRTSQPRTTTFAGTALPSLAAGLSWDLAYLPTTVRLSVVGNVLSADFDGDGDQDGADFLRWQRGFGLTAGATHSQGDADGDHDVDAADLAIWKANFGVPPSVGPAAVAVPEPHLGILAASAGVGIAALGRRRKSIGASLGKRCGAFTLVELLVVIAIIGALIARLLPAVQSAGRRLGDRSAQTISASLPWRFSNIMQHTTIFRRAGTIGIWPLVTAMAAQSWAKTKPPVGASKFCRTSRTDCLGPRSHRRDWIAQSAFLLSVSTRTAVVPTAR